MTWSSSGKKLNATIWLAPLLCIDSKDLKDFLSLSTDKQRMDNKNAEALSWIYRAWLSEIARKSAVTFRGDKNFLLNMKSLKVKRKIDGR